MPIALHMARIIDPNTDTRPQAMPAGDYLLWQRWLPTVRHNIATLWTDVPLRHDNPPPPDADPITRYWWRTNALRADAIARTRSDNWWLIEVHAGDPAEALGHLAAYTAAWYAEPPQPNAPVTPILITDTNHPTYQQAAARAGILYWHITAYETPSPP